MLVILYQRTSVYRVYSLIFRNFPTLLSFFVDFADVQSTSCRSYHSPNHLLLIVISTSAEAGLRLRRRFGTWKDGSPGEEVGNGELHRSMGPFLEKNHSKWGRWAFFHRNMASYGIIGFEALKNLSLFRSFGEVPRNAFSAPGSRTEVWKETLFRDVSKTILPMRFFFGVNIHLPFVVVCKKGWQGLDSYIPIWRRIIRIDNYGTEPKSWYINTCFWHFIFLLEP